MRSLLTRRASVNANTLKISIHCCQLDRECRKYDPHPPPRIHLNTPWFHFGFAYWPSGKFAGRIDMDAWRERREVVFVDKRSYWTNFRRKPADRQPQG